MTEIYCLNKIPVSRGLYFFAEFIYTYENALAAFFYFLYEVLLAVRASPLFVVGILYRTHCDHEYFRCNEPFEGSSPEFHCVGPTGGEEVSLIHDAKSAEEREYK